MSSIWHKAAALALGTSIATAIGLVTMHFRAPSYSLPDPVWLWKTLQIHHSRSGAEEFRERILADMSDGQREDWAGSYSWSNGFEHRELDIGPAGFFYEYSHCTGTGQLAYGEVVEVDGARVRLAFLWRVNLEEPLPSNDHRRSRFRLEEELFCISWGEERFLIPAGLMGEFCSLANAPMWDSMKYADYPRKIRLGANPWRHPALGGLPDVPPEFRHLLPQ